MQLDGAADHSRGQSDDGVGLGCLLPEGLSLGMAVVQVGVPPLKGPRGNVFGDEGHAP